MITFKKQLTEAAIPPTVIEYFEEFPNEEMVPSHDDVVKFMWRLNSYFKITGHTFPKTSFLFSCSNLLPPGYTVLRRINLQSL